MSETRSGEDARVFGTPEIPSRMFYIDTAGGLIAGHISLCGETYNTGIIACFFNMHECFSQFSL